MSAGTEQAIGDYLVRVARPADVAGARSVILDTLYRVLGYGYVPEWHADVVDLAGTYLDNPRHALFVAVHQNHVVGTAAVRARGPKRPDWLVERYPSTSTAELTRTYVRPEHRRHGLANAMIDLACEFVASDAGYQAIYLHTDPAIEGAEPFWRSIGKEVHDSRTAEPYDGWLHFEIPLPA
ncbi:ribosomal protein S18 acetylase RimI-like enzyme [Tamaricihabitans halophyticus]|uniref:Ribosomal protein S18 acetylase RimI-like enzyme n=1 Tax=Tamaricihabitans halophyticus TaxID=1262583 RepID=A0A4R2R1F6_9PSEU|nr:GNAT family N-acetyltransferase [Tamaricihabitans halophyticus]TCP56333.1 ribosomal protein S18 acetylase RimI-like enzyme [Tamaricihabitans halophyticus]